MRKSNRLNREGQRRRALGIAISALLVLAAVVLVALGGDGEDDPAAVDTAPRLVDGEEIAALGDSLGLSVYWAGERPPDRIELVQDPSGNVFLRYLPPGVEPGDPAAAFLTVGTYPFGDPVGGLEQTATETGGSLQTAPDGARMLVDPGSDSVYLAYPDSGLQVEVYDPAGGALDLIEAGEVEPAG